MTASDDDLEDLLEDLLTGDGVDDPDDPDDETEIPNANATPQAVSSFQFILDGSNGSSGSDGSGIVIQAKSGDFTLGRGIMPSVANIQCAPVQALLSGTDYEIVDYDAPDEGSSGSNEADWQAYRTKDLAAPAFPTFTGTLRIGDGRATLEFPNCRASMVNGPFTNTTQDLSIDIRDTRWQWKYQEIVSGHFNRQDEDKKLITDGTYDFGLSTQYQGVRTVRELATMLGNRLGYFDGGITNALNVEGLPVPGSDDPNFAYPEFEWDATPAAEALQELVTRYGCHIAIAPTNQAAWEDGALGQSGTTVYDGLWIYAPNGTGAFGGPPVSQPETEVAQQLPEATEEELEQVGQNRPKYSAIYRWQVQDAPEKIICDTGPRRHQTTMALTAVGLDLDKTWKPVEEMDMRPAGGWTPATLKEFEKNAEYIEADYMNRNVFRCFQLPGSANFPPFDGSAEGSDVLASPVYQRTELMQRVLAELVTRGIDTSGEERYLDPFCTGRSRTLRDLKDPVTASGAAEGTNDSGTDSRVKVGFTFDRANNVIRFDEPVFQLTGDADGSPDYESAVMVDPQLKLTAAFRGERSQFELTGIGGAAGNFARFKRDDLHEDWTIDGTTSTLLNGSEVAAQAETYLKDARAKYQAIPTPVIATYELIYPYWPDGLLSEVSWTVSNSAVPKTVGSWGVMHTSSLDPRVIQRLQNQRNQSDKINQKLFTDQEDMKRFDSFS